MSMDKNVVKDKRWLASRNSVRRLLIQSALNCPSLPGLER